MPPASRAASRPAPPRERGAPLDLLLVDEPAAFALFVELPSRLYHRDPGFVPPLRREERRRLDPRRSAYFEHARARYWLALRDGEPIGRISAQIDELHLERHGDATGQFGLLDALDDPELFAVLTGTAEAWLGQNGIRRVRGPFNLSVNQDCGLLVQGFERPATIMTSYAPPYAGARLEALGYAKAKDLLGYVLDPRTRAGTVAARLLDRVGGVGRVVVRPADMRRYADEIALIGGLFNDAWAENWGFVPLTPAELKEMADALRPMIRPDLVRIAEVDGEPACMVVALPDLNEAIRDLGGRLLPFGWARLLWRLKVAGVRSCRVPLMGLARRWQRTPLGAALLGMVLGSVRDAMVARGFRQAELSWILEDNLAMRRLVEALGARADKTWRIYEKALA